MSNDTTPHVQNMASPVLLSFDVEEHHRIEAAAGLDVPVETQAEYAKRMESTTDRILELLAQNGNIPATFYIVVEIATSHPQLLRRIAEQGHEIGSHSHQHLRIHRMTPASFRADLQQSIDALQQATGCPVHGFRAPTFSVTAATAWAVDVLIESGLQYDSSIFPVRHDRYGVADAPTQPFLLQGTAGQILELPPLTYRLLRGNLPVAGGGYFRLFPLGVMKRAIRQCQKQERGPSMLYFHPWEFDPSQPKLPLKRVSKFRTYVGVQQTMKRLTRLIQAFPGQFQRASDYAQALREAGTPLPTYTLPQVQAVAVAA